MVAGTKPFVGDNVATILCKIVHKEPISPGQLVVRKCVCSLPSVLGQLLRTRVPLFLGRLIFFDDDPMGVGVGIVPDSGDLP